MLSLFLRASCLVFFWKLAGFLLLDLIVLSNCFVTLIVWCVSSDVTAFVLFWCGEVGNDFVYGHRACGL